MSTDVTPAQPDPTVPARRRGAERRSKEGQGPEGKGAERKGAERKVAAEHLDTAVLQEWMEQALEQAQATAETQDVPVGALVVDADGAVIGRGRNAREASGDPTAHAEVLALREAADALGTWRLEGCTLVVTLEPCVMCTGAAAAARVARVVFGAWDVKAGACGSVWDLARDPLALHQVDVVGGVLAERSAQVLGDFFAGRRLG